MLNVIALMLLALFFSSSAYASEDDTGVVKGHVNFCGKGGVAGMRIYVPGRQFFVITGDDGKFVFDRMPAGEYELNYMLNGNVIKHKTAIFVFKQRESDIGEVMLCDDPNFKPEPASISTPTIEQAAPASPSPSAADVSAEGGCKEGNIIKLPNGSGECKDGKIILFSCDKKWSDCDDVVENGCETDIWTDNRNCGKCGNQCSNIENCLFGECS